MKNAIVASILAGTTALIVLACGSTEQPTATVACAQTIDAYCASANPTCAKKIDPNDVVKSFCAGSSLASPFGTSACGAVTNVDTRLSDSVTRTYQYDTKTGALVAVYDYDSGAKAVTCVAGPSPLPAPPNCASNLVAYQCGTKTDGGTDAAKD